MSDSTHDGAVGISGKQINAAVRVDVRDGVGVVITSHPPVNALSLEVRVGLIEAIGELQRRDDVDALVLACDGRTFFAGADINEFGSPPQPPFVGEVVAALEEGDKPVVAALHGSALGGGLEIALGCHYRIAVASTRLGLPEVNLGIIPGAGGTQRLPRIVGAAKAVEMLVGATIITAEEALEIHLIDRIAVGDLVEDAVAFARETSASGGPWPRTRDRNVELDGIGDPETWFEEQRQRAAAQFKGQIAPVYAVSAVESATTLPIDEGLAREFALTMELGDSSQARAQQHIFLAERAVAKVPGVSPDARPIDVERLVVIGAGTMGSGIATAVVNAGLPVAIIDTDQDRLANAEAVLRGNWQRQVDRGRISADQLEERMALVTPTLDMEAVADADVIVEAVWEQMALKRSVFEQVDRRAKPGAILATNTSSLDINEIARATSRPESVIGLHFFVPAHVMRLLEVVRGDATSDEAIVTAIALGKRLKKVPVVVGVCDGFVGNRLLGVREAQSARLLLEGAAPQQVDRVLTDFGFPMGSFQMQDMAGGIELGWRMRQANGQRDPVADRLAEMGRYGQKVQRGWYRYDAGDRTPIPDPEVDAVIRAVAEEEGVEQRSFDDDELLARLVHPMINEGAKLLDEGIAARPGDIDVIYIYGYGWPVYRGGPMWWADEVGLETIRDSLNALAAEHGDVFAPASLLERLAAEGRGFGS